MWRVRGPDVAQRFSAADHAGLKACATSGLYPTDYYQITINAETAKLAETIFHSRLILRDLRVLCVQRRDRY
jgi:hypothetical protein